jgi:hypothetical protein
VSETTSRGIYVALSGTPPIVGVRNNISNNAQYGIYNATNGVRSFTLGRFVGNGTYAIYNLGADTLDATQNWWGDAAGAGGGTADSVLGAVDVSNPLTSDPTDVPALAPPAMSVPSTAPVSSTAAQPLLIDDDDVRRAVERYRAEKQAAIAARKDAKQAQWEALEAQRQRETEQAIQAWEAAKAARRPSTR